jgi:hypothetical protein
MPHEPAYALRFMVVALTVLGTVANTRAQPTAAATDSGSLRVSIVHIDGDDIVIDAGADSVKHVAQLTVYRTLEVRHPITHKVLRDRFAIGALSVVQTGARLSIARVQGVPAHPFAVGDTVELAPSPNQPPSAAVSTESSKASASSAVNAQATESSQAAPGTAAASEAAAATRPLDVEERELLAYWYATLSKAPAARVLLYSAFLQRHPRSRYRSFVQGEMSYLHALQVHANTLAQVPSGTLAQAPRIRVRMLPLRHAEEGVSVELAAVVDRTPEFRSLLVHVRALHEPAQVQTFLADLDERGHARTIVPASLVHAPGFSYFIESVDTQGHTEAGVASAGAPQIVAVASKTAKPQPVAPTTRVQYTSELVSFDEVSGRDWFLLNEGDFLYRVRYQWLYALRLGYGNYRGQGGTVEELDRLQLEPKPAGFTYGFVETQFELHRLFGLALRGTVGLGRPEVPGQERKGVTGGFQIRARIGSGEGTHLELAGELLPEIGQRAYIGLHWEAIERLPMATEVVVTDQPVHSDELAVRLVYELGYRVSDRIAVALRPSYQLRTIRHAGPGIGLSTTFDW